MGFFVGAQSTRRRLLQTRGAKSVSRPMTSGRTVTEGNRRFPTFETQWFLTVTVHLLEVRSPRFRSIATNAKAGHVQQFSAVIHPETFFQSTRTPASVRRYPDLAAALYRFRDYAIERILGRIRWESISQCFPQEIEPSIQLAREHITRIQ